MGGFFLSSSKRAAERAAKFFSAVELPFEERAMGGFRLLLLGKKYMPEHRNYHESVDGAIGGAGTWMTNKAFGYAALAEILSDSLHDPARLGDVAGHSAFVTHRAGRVSIITDKTGTYPVYASSDASGRHYSSSLLALAEASEKLTWNRQALLEFINVEAFIGEETLFENIRSLPYGAIIDVTEGLDGGRQVARYYRAADRACTTSDLLEGLRAHVSRLKAAQFGAGAVCCDLSGGRDSRTVAAILHSAGVAHILNTNVNPYDPGDHVAAVNAATSLSRPIALYRYSGQHVKTDVGYVFPRMDLARDVFFGKHELRFLEGKATRHGMILGGYGGELFRDVYSHPKSARDVVNSYYCKGLRLTESRRSDYVERLTNKFLASLSYWDFPDDQRASERLYFFEKMRAWGGSRIALFNRYSHCWHPLLDHRIQRHMFTVPIESKKAGQFQHEITAALDAELAAQPYTKGKPRTLRARLSRVPALKSAYRQAKRLVGSAQDAAESASPEPQEDPMAARYGAALRDFEELSGVSLANCVKANHRMRYLTLVEAFVRYRGKS
jgi:hypothetical protein